MLQQSLRRNPKKAFAKRKVRQARPGRSVADSYTITATVPVPLPTSTAPITDPFDQTHFTTTSVTISGSCPSNTYVELTGTAVIGEICLSAGKSLSCYGPLQVIRNAALLAP
jgi:hypothetical protein